MLSLILIIPGLACLYALLLRPLLHKIPAFQKFYAEADGFWSKIWAMCGRSITVLWSYILGGISAAMGLLDKLSPILGDAQVADLKSKITDAVANPKVLAYVLGAISLITLASRLRSFMKVE